MVHLIISGQEGGWGRRVCCKYLELNLFWYFALKR